MSGKEPQSGLRTLQRDWSSSQPTVQPSSEPTPQRQSPPAKDDKQAAIQRRLKLIQDALAGNDLGETPPQPHGQALAPMRSNVPNKKRPSDPTNDEPTAKKRVLPDTWNESQNPRSSRAEAKANGTITISTTKVATVSKGKVSKVFLSQEQKQILELVHAGNSVFYTGSAGTGKSVLLREIIRDLRKKFARTTDAVAITASTGIAACNIGGVTIHSFAGIGLGLENAEELAIKIRKNKKATTRWLRTKVLIIDEVSMVDGDLFDKLARIGAILRKNTKPFGGIQVIVTGDFFQLPPVTKGQPKFAFEAALWDQTIQRTFNLTKVFRQRDQEFIDMLNEMRFGCLTNKSIQKFKSLSRAIIYEDGIAATELFPRREDVDRSNSSRMQQLQTEHRRYDATDSGTLEGAHREKVLANCMAAQTLQLRVDAQVMLIKNVDDTLVNGSMGKVVAFVDPAKVDEEILGEEKGKEGVKKVVNGRGKEWPVVEFVVPGGVRKVIVQPEPWKVELPNGEVQAQRSQLPLILAWAMSIHKSQGQTLDRVKVDLGKVFEKGQAYVALSRATSLDGLQVLNFDATKVNAHPKVIEWSRTLETLDL